LCHNIANLVCIECFESTHCDHVSQWLKSWTVDVNVCRISAWIIDSNRRSDTSFVLSNTIVIEYFVASRHIIWSKWVKSVCDCRKIQDLVIWIESHARVCARGLDRA